MGLDVVLVEREPEPGGLLRQINRLSPHGEKAADRVAEMAALVASRPNVTVYLGSRVEEVGGYIGNFEITIRPEGGDALTEKAGCIVAATGAVPLKPEGLYGYDAKRVITQIELEERLLKGAMDARRVVMIQCVRARCAEREYCSRICCQIAVKNARLIREQDPEAQVHILYRDMQMYGTENEQMLWDARGEGVRFDVFSPDQPPVVKEDRVQFFRQLTGETMDIPCDLVVLSTPLIPSEGAQALSQLLRVPVDQNGFFLEAHAKLRPLDFATDGIFVCGSARYPANVEEAVSQGLGASSRIATILFKDKLITSAIVADIDPETCVGCMGCMEMCPYEAISYVPEKNICTVNTVLCKGCGCCAATCPSHSASLKGFKPEQLLSQIRAI